MSRIINKTQRWLNLERLLSRSPNGVRVTELAETLGVHRSTIYRDIEQLDQTGFPIWQEDGLVGILVDKHLAPLRLNIHEALSLFIAARLLSRQSGERDPHVVSLLQKLGDTLPFPVSEHLLKSAQIINTRPEDNKYIHHLEILMWAWVHRRRVRMWYQSAWRDDVKERLFDIHFVEPLETVYSCYVIGLDHWYGEVRTFKIKRIQKIEITDEEYVIKDSFDIFERWANSWGIVMTVNSSPIKVKLRFSKNVAFMIKEAIWHPSQRLDDNDDGGCLFSVVVSHTLGIKLWIRTWGPDVEILEPNELRLEVAREAMMLNSLYKDLNLSSSDDWNSQYSL